MESGIKTTFKGVICIGLQYYASVALVILFGIQGSVLAFDEGIAPKPLPTFRAYLAHDHQHPCIDGCPIYGEKGNYLGTISFSLSIRTYRHSDVAQSLGFRSCFPKSSREVAECIQKVSALGGIVLDKTNYWQKTATKYGELMAGSLSESLEKEFSDLPRPLATGGYYSGNEFFAHLIRGARVIEWTDNYGMGVKVCSGLKSICGNGARNEFAAYILNNKQKILDRYIIDWKVVTP